MKLIELFRAIKEKALTKEHIEGYRDELVSLYAEMKIEFAELEKEEALYLLSSNETSWVGKKVSWKGSEHGQRMITLKNYIGATSKVIDSLKSRLYSLY